MNDRPKNTPRRGRKSNSLSLRPGPNPAPEKAKSIIEGLKAKVRARSGFTPQQFADYLLGEAQWIADEATGRHVKRDGGWYEFSIPDSPLRNGATLEDFRKQHSRRLRHASSDVTFHKESIKNIAELQRHLYETDEGFDRRHAIHPVTSRLVLLIGDVKNITGRQHYDELADIFSALGWRIPSSRIRKFWSLHQ